MGPSFAPRRTRPSGPRVRTLFPLLASLASLALAPAAPVPPPTPAPVAPAPERWEADRRCEATFDPSVVEQGIARQDLEVTFTEDIGPVYDVETDPVSGLRAAWLFAAADPPDAGRVRVSAVDADAGEWEVTFHGERGVCRGVVTVVPGG